MMQLKALSVSRLPSGGILVEVAITPLNKPVYVRDRPLVLLDGVDLAGQDQLACFTTH